MLDRDPVARPKARRLEVAWHTAIVNSEVELPLVRTVRRELYRAGLRPELEVLNLGRPNGSGKNDESTAIWSRMNGLGRADKRFDLAHIVHELNSPSQTIEFLTLLGYDIVSRTEFLELPLETRVQLKVCVFNFLVEFPSQKDEALRAAISKNLVEWTDGRG